MKGRSGADRHQRVLRRLDQVSLWAHRGAVVLLLLAFMMAMLAPNAVALAGDDDPAGQAAGTMVGIFLKLAKLFITVAYVLIQRAWQP